MKRICTLIIMITLSQTLLAQSGLPQLDNNYIKSVSQTNISDDIIVAPIAAVGETIDCNSFTVDLDNQLLTFTWNGPNDINIPDGPNGDWTGFNFIYNAALTNQDLLPEGAYVWKVDAHYIIDHTYVGDLEIKLFTTVPATNSWMIRNNEGGGEDYIDETRTDTEVFFGQLAGQNWYFQVHDTAGYDTGSITYVQLTIYYKHGDEKPDLEPYLPVELEWDDKIVISNVTNTNTSATELYNDEAIYVDYSCLNSGNTEALDFKYGLYLDDVLVKYADVNSLAINYFSYVLDSKFEPLSAGIHSFKIVCDYDEKVAELDESNNEYSKQFTVIKRLGRSINGYKFNDINADGIWDSNEPGLKGWRIFADLNNNYIWDSSEPNDITDGNGAYSLRDLDSGSYIIMEVNQPDWLQTYPSDTYPAEETLPQALLTPVVSGPTTYSDLLSYSELANIKTTAMDSPPKKSLVKWKDQIGKGKRFKSWKQVLEADAKKMLDEPQVKSLSLDTSASQETSAAGDVVLDGVPTSQWTYGCSATSAGMIFGYYDRHGYPNMYTGPTNNGVAPLTDLGQGDTPSSPIAGACSMIATQNGFDGRTTAGHVDDYWIGYNETGPDPWETSGVEHTWGDCTADFMGTNQWKWAFNNDNGVIDFNIDGSTALFSAGAEKLYDFVPDASAGSPQTELCHGMRLFAESRGYIVTENYTQQIDTYATGGFSFEDYKNEIDNAYPVMIQVDGHSMVGVGYNDSTQEIILHDTWDNTTHRMNWGGSYSGMLHEAVTVIHLAPANVLNNVHQVVLGNDVDVNDINFGNNSTPGSISGYKFNDIDADGIWGNNEPGLQGWQIFVDLNQNYQFDANEPNTITDANGAYTITGLYPGTYTIAEVNQPNWQQTYPILSSSLSQQNARVIKSVEISTTNSDNPIYIQGEIVKPASGSPTGMMTQQSGSLINMDDFRNDSRFADINGRGYSVVIIDTGIDVDHPYFGTDSDNDGIADRIVFQYDFANDDYDASDKNGHGSNVSSIIGSQNSVNKGMAPGVNLIVLKVFKDDGTGNFGYTEDALQWVINNIDDYNIVSVNMSLGDNENYTTHQSLYGIHDELTKLAAEGVIVVSASGNDFYTFSSQQGVAYPSADEFSLSIGAVYDSITSGYTYSSGAVANTTTSDQICPFSQRNSALTTIFAPGAPITGANNIGSTVTMHGTSQASPHIAGIVPLAQQLADKLLGRRLGVDEFVELMRSTAVTINDGDDENDNVIHTNLDFPRVNMMALAEAIYSLRAQNGGVHQVKLGRAENVSDINFGNHGTSCGDWGYYDGDINNDCYVNYEDLYIIASTWLGSGDGDINTDTDTNFEDYAILANQWLLCSDPLGLDCDNLLE
ncbi:MAG TPA: S8 family serine peptidase [Sedimentisphaerales bacterium]|nr:S8 family serine peptidase [Sedimentisphaerales bacterium]